MFLIPCPLFPQNAIIILNSTRTPLVIDPSSQVCGGCDKWGMLLTLPPHTHLTLPQHSSGL